MVGGNYPPGMSKRDFIRAGIDEPHHHEHEWEADDSRADPIIEDGAAIFHLQCRYVEGQYGEGWECEETKSYRFEYDALYLLDGGEITLPTIEEWGKVDEKVESVVVAIEEAFVSGDSRASIDVDPDPDDGCVEIEYLGYTLRYEA